MWYGNGFMWHTNIETLKSGSEKMLWTMWNWVEEGDLKYISFVDETDFMSFLYLAEIPSSISHPDAPNRDLMLYRTEILIEEQQPSMKGGNVRWKDDVLWVWGIDGPAWSRSLFLNKLRDASENWNWKKSWVNENHACVTWPPSKQDVNTGHYIGKEHIGV